MPRDLEYAVQKQDTKWENSMDALSLKEAMEMENMGHYLHHLFDRGKLGQRNKLDQPRKSVHYCEDHSVKFRGQQP